jgi:hypothetical protein
MDLQLHTRSRGINSSALKSFHVARRELERKCEIVLLAENARMELKSSANESSNLPLAVKPSKFQQNRSGVGRAVAIRR